MKRIIALFLVGALLTVGGCGLSLALKEAKQQDPTAAFVPIHEDDDDIPEAWGKDTTGDGIADEEIPDTREALEQAGSLDENIELLLLTIAGFGIPGVGVAAKWWGKLKPTKRAVNAERLLAGTIESVQAAKKAIQDPTIKNGNDALAAINKALHDVQVTVTGLENAIAHIKADLEK